MRRKENREDNFNTHYFPFIFPGNELTSQIPSDLTMQSLYNFRCTAEAEAEADAAQKSTDITGMRLLSRAVFPLRQYPFTLGTSEEEVKWRTASTIGPPTPKTFFTVSSLLNYLLPSPSKSDSPASWLLGNGNRFAAAAKV